MSKRDFRLHRRAFVGAVGASFFTTRGLFAETLQMTPPLTEGPFYPDKLPLDQDNDLIIVGDHTTPAVGAITHLTGRILSSSGEPIKNAVVEIWQCDANAVYLHTADSNRKKKQQDQNFQGFGRFETDSKGQYRFRTIKPVAYPGRPSPHIHVKIKKGDKEQLTTQLFVRGHSGNEKDGVFRMIRNKADRELVLVDFKSVEGSKIGEFSANFDVVLGRTPAEGGDPFRRRRAGGPPPRPPRG
jgi:protocatechuate 3,4-dioxygenase beta subunit